MKRDEEIKTAGTSTGVLENDLSQEQFAGIGKVAVSYNEAEQMIPLALGSALGFNMTLFPIISRVNGLETIAEMAKTAIRTITMPDPLHQEMCMTIGDFMLCKKYRDGVVHARPFLPHTGIGKTPGKKGALFEILLTPDALNGLAERLKIFRVELVAMNMVITELLITDRFRKFNPPHVAIYESQIGPMLRAHLARYRQERARRVSLARLPEFPEIPQDQQGMDYQQLVVELSDAVKKAMNPDHPGDGRE